MMINKISFSGVQNRTNVRAQQTRQQMPPRNVSCDTFDRTSDTHKQNKNSGVHPFVKILTLLLALGTVNTCAYSMGQNAQVDEYLNAPYGIVVNGELSYEQLANTTGVPLSVILWANNANDAQEVPQTVIIPKKYDATAQKRAKLEEKIASDDTSDEDKAKYQKELDSLEEKKVKQDELVVVYRNSEDELFIIPNSYGVSCEDLKEAFGIKDGVIRKYNQEKLDYKWNSCLPDGGAIKDYSDAIVPVSGIVLPKDAIVG